MAGASPVTTARSCRIATRPSVVVTLAVARLAVVSLHWNYSGIVIYTSNDDDTVTTQYKTLILDQEKKLS